MDDNFSGVDNVVVQSFLDAMFSGILMFAIGCSAITGKIPYLIDEIDSFGLER